MADDGSLLVSCFARRDYSGGRALSSAPAPTWELVSHTDEPMTGRAFCTLKRRARACRPAHLYIGASSQRLGRAAALAGAPMTVFIGTLV